MFTSTLISALIFLVPHCFLGCPCPGTAAYSGVSSHQLAPFQKINHFPGMTEICRKDLLARNLNRMQKLYPTEYSFFPRTWCLPAE